jgi:Glycosyl hydrolase family 26
VKPLRLVLPVLLALATASPAAACITFGVYQDNPAASLAPLDRTVGKGISMISTYLTAGKPLAQSVIKTANREHAGVMVTWQPDGGRDGAKQPRFRLKNVAAGRYDASLAALVAQLRAVRAGAILRPMPEMNTNWYAWSGTVNGNSPAEYVKAWKRVRRAVRSAAGGRKVKLLWAPYAWSIPDTGANQISAYFPGSSQVDLVGASGYNFGAQAPLTWSDPGDLFAAPYQQIEALTNKPFWLAETGSTGVGGDEAGWIESLATLQSSGMPELAGIVWYDVKDPTGDFLLSGRPVTTAFKSLLKEACR